MPLLDFVLEYGINEVKNLLGTTEIHGELERFQGWNELEDTSPEELIGSSAKSVDILRQITDRNNAKAWLNLLEFLDKDELVLIEILELIHNENLIIHQDLHKSRISLCHKIQKEENTLLHSGIIKTDRFRRADTCVIEKLPHCGIKGSIEHGRPSLHNGLHLCLDLIGGKTSKGDEADLVFSGSLGHNLTFYQM
jgi:hypothetical protein